MKEKFFLVLKLIGIALLTLIVWVMWIKKDWVIAVGAGLGYGQISIYILDEYYAESKPAAIAAFIGTIVACIVRVAANNAAGIVFYVFASICNAAFCTMMSIDFATNSYARHNNSTYIRNRSDARRYIRERRDLENHNMFFGVLNAIIFGIFALIGCFKPWTSFLALGWLVIRLIYVLIRSRLQY